MYVYICAVYYIYVYIPIYVFLTSNKLAAWLRVLAYTVCIVYLYSGDIGIAYIVYIGMSI
jgi:hypothetical protein